MEVYKIEPKYTNTNKRNYDCFKNQNFDGLNCFFFFFISPTLGVNFSQFYPTNYIKDINGSSLCDSNIIHNYLSSVQLKI